MPRRGPHSGLRNGPRRRRRRRPRRPRLLLRPCRPAPTPVRRSSRARRFLVERADGRCAFDWKPARSRRIGGVPTGPGDGRDIRDRAGRRGPAPERRSRGAAAVVEVVTAVVGAPATGAALPARPMPADCPNLPQRPRSSRDAREESLIFRAFLRGRSRPGAPLWQIWTRPPPRIIPGAPPAPSHARSSPTPRRPRPLSRQSCEVRLNEPFSSGESSSGVLRGDAGRSRRSSSPAHAMRAQLAEIHLSSHNVSSARQNPSELNSCELSSHNVS